MYPITKCAVVYLQLNTHLIAPIYVRKRREDKLTTTIANFVVDMI